MKKTSEVYAAELREKCLSAAAPTRIPARLVHVEVMDVVEPLILALAALLAREAK